jgi:glycosyltransferase involved in cell wall biosynthesis
MAADGDLLVDRTEEDTIPNAMERLATDAAEVNRLRDRGRALAARFSRARIARQMLAIYERIVQERPLSVAAGVVSAAL